MTRRAIPQATPRIGARTSRPSCPSLTSGAHGVVQCLGQGVGPGPTADFDHEFDHDFDNDFGRGVARR
jgi:hypothetical protein